MGFNISLIALVFILVFHGFLGGKAFLRSLSGSWQNRKVPLSTLVSTGNAEVGAHTAQQVKVRIFAVAHEADTLTAGVTKTFSFENQLTMQQARNAILPMKQAMDTHLMVSKQKLLKMMPKDTPLSDAFLAGFNSLLQCQRSAMDLLTKLLLSSSSLSSSASGSNDISKLPEGNFTDLYDKHKHCKYSSNVERGGHIVAEYFEYIERLDESKEVVEAMQSRQKARKESEEDDQESDKMNNRLIAIPANPGSGKSTFLVHFPESTAYREYAGEAIVSTLSFNGDMGVGSKGDCIGLRVVYGAFKGMGLLSEAYCWSDFVKQFGHELPVDRDEISTAVEVLRKVFGRDRRVLILVDELSKSEDPRDICRKLGMILDKDGDVDVIVSSLSPAFIEKLVTSYQRGIDYVVLQSLARYDLGKAECIVWADKVIKASRCDNLSESKKNMLYNAYMLYSGHPRSLQFMCELFADVNRWKVYEELAQNLRYYESFKILEKYLIGGESLPTLMCIVTLSALDVKRFIMSTKPSQAGDRIFGEFVETGALNIVRAVNKFKFQTSTQAIVFYRFVRMGPRGPEFLAEPPIAAAFSLFQFLTFDKISLLWERMVCLNIVWKLYDYGSRDLLDALGIMDTGNIIPRKVLPLKKPVKIEFKDTRSCYSDKRVTALILPLRPDNPGFDAVLRISDDSTGKPHSFYLETKLMKEKEHVNSMAWTIKKCIDDYQFRTKNLGRLFELHICVYIFDEDLEGSVREEGGGDSKACASEELRSHLEDSALALQFVNEHFGNFHVIGKDKLERWMNPTLLPLAQMIKNVCPCDDKE